MIHTTFVGEPTPGNPLRGDIRRPDGPIRSAVVVVHGFKGFKDWGFFPHACERLARAGHVVVSFNLTHNGIGDDPQAFTELERFGRNTLTRELDEIHWVLDRVFDGGILPERPEKVGVLGHSRGGGQAILATGEDDRVAALTTWAAVSHFDRWSDAVKAAWRDRGVITVTNARTGQEMPLNVTLLEDYEANRDRLDIGSAAARLRQPWLIVHGSSDETVPASEGEELASRARAGDLLLVERAGHTFQARHPFAASTPELDVALGATLRHFATHLVV